MLRHSNTILRRHHLQFILLHVFGGEHDLVHRGGNVLKRIAQQETRHVAFYTTQARMALERSAAAPKIVRTLMQTAWRPVGSGVMDDSEVRYVMGHLFAGQGEALDKLDQSVANLPGLDGLQIFRTAFARLGVTV